MTSADLLHVGVSKKKAKIASVPAYKRIAEALVKEIQSKRLNPGDAVPSERDLATEHKVSLMTARQALQQLASEGIVSRLPNVGSFVAPPKIQFNRLSGVLELSFKEEMLSHGYSPESRDISNTLTTSDGEVSDRLALPLRSKLVRLQRLFMSSGEAFMVETSYMAASRFAGILEERMELRSLFQILANSYGVRISYADEEVDATSADAKTAGLLRIRTGAPILRIRQVLFEAGGPVVYSVTHYRSDRHVVLIRRYR